MIFTGLRGCNERNTVCRNFMMKCKLKEVLIFFRNKSPHPFYIKLYKKTNKLNTEECVFFYDYYCDDSPFEFYKSIFQKEHIMCRDQNVEGAKSSYEFNHSYTKQLQLIKRNKTKKTNDFS